MLVATALMEQPSLETRAARVLLYDRSMRCRALSLERGRLQSRSLVPRVQFRRRRCERVPAWHRGGRFTL